MRFEGIDFSKCEVKEMNPDLVNPGQGFKCIRNDFATYIKGRKIKMECKSLTSKCWIVEHGSNLADPDTGYDISGYYKRFGFEVVNIENAQPCGNFRTMYFDIKAVVEQANALRRSV